jgi:hypothetical protein
VSHGRSSHARGAGRANRSRRSPTALDPRRSRHPRLAAGDPGGPDAASRLAPAVLREPRGPPADASHRARDRPARPGRGRPAVASPPGKRLRRGPIADRRGRHTRHRPARAVERGGDGTPRSSRPGDRPYEVPSARVCGRRPSGGWPTRRHCTTDMTPEGAHA